MNRVPCLAALLLTLALVGCKAEATTLKVDKNRVPPKHFSIKPADTELPGHGKIGTANDGWAPNRGHEVYRPGWVAQAGASLVVFLPGCGGEPAGYKEFLETACDQGYHVIGLDYPNECGMNNACGTDPRCPGSYRREVALGKKANTLVKLGTHPQDAINKRLKAVLLRLQQKEDVQGGWEQFLVADATAEEKLRPRYANMVFAGHSLGAGYAAFFGDQLKVARVIMISNPADAIDDCSDGGDPSCTDKNSVAVDWLKGPHETSPDAFHGLVHRSDLHDNHYHRIIAAWNALHVPKGQRYVVRESCTDRCTSPKKGDPCAFPCDPHNAPATLSKRYRNTWIEMLGRPVIPVAPPK